MPPKKAKAKAKAGAKAEAKAKAAPKAAESETAKEKEEKEIEKADPVSSSPAAGSGVAAVRELKATAEEEEKKDQKDTQLASSDTAAAEGKSSDEDKEAKTSLDSAKAQVEEAEEVDLSSIPDPWEKVSDESAVSKIKEEDWEVIELTGSEPTQPSHLAAKEAELTQFRPKASYRQYLIAADFAGNSLPKISAAGGPMWLRFIALGMNPLESLDGLADLYPRLLVIDLSFVELPSIDGAWSALAACKRLRRIVAEGASVDSFEDMEDMPALRTLELTDNALEDLAELDALAKKAKNLEELDLRENDLASEPGYLKKVKKLFPKLTWLDNQSQKEYKAKGVADAYKDMGTLDSSFAAVDGMFKNESCSCLEGNPCLDPATCKDWKNREKVAAEARKKKGLRDESGKQL